MQTTQPIDTAERDAARVILLEHQLSEIVHAAEGLVRVVPLKGIDLITTLYREQLDRRVGDIDILVTPESGVDAFVRRLENAGYRPQFAHLADRTVLASKGKIAMRSTRPDRTDVDVHTRLVTKKFYAPTVEAFNRDALLRLTQSAEDIPGVWRLDDVDRWLYLATHACFHIYSDAKWTRDLELLARGASADAMEDLIGRARRYDMRRVIWSAMNQLGMSHYAQLACPESGRWQRFVRRAIRVRHTKEWCVWRRIITPMWEIIFIDHRAARHAAVRRVVCPSVTQMATIYRCRKQVAPAYYPLHIVAATFGLLVLGCIGVAWSIERKKKR